MNVRFSFLQATEALLSTEEEDTPTASPTVTSAGVPPSPAGAFRPPLHPQPATQSQRTAPTPVASLNFSSTASPQASTSVAGQATAVQQPTQQQQQQAGQVAGTPTTPSLPPVKVEDMHRWLYKDPQGEIQGVCHCVHVCVCVCVSQCVCICGVCVCVSLCLCV